MPIKKGPMFHVNLKGTFHIDFSQVFCMRFQLCFALCCALGLKEMLVNLTEVNRVNAMHLVMPSLNMCIAFQNHFKTTLQKAVPYNPCWISKKVIHNRFTAI